jgi:outer membrane protein assembly factor BamB
MIKRSLLCTLLLPAALFAGEWPQYRTNAGVTTERVGKPWTSTPKIVWKAPSEGGFSSFVVGGGNAFTLALKEIDGAAQETLIALDAANGKEKWVAPLNFANFKGGGESGTPDNKGGDGPRSTPAIIGDKVYAYSSLLSLRCFEAKTGKVVWTRDVLKEHNGRNISWLNATSPFVEGGLIYIAGGGQGESLMAIDPKDGKVVWKAFDEMLTHATPIAATIGGQRQVIFFMQSGLLSVEPKTGKELWRYAFPFKTSTAASPVVFQDIVYCSAGYGVGCGAVKVAKSGGKFTATEIYRLTGNKPVANHWSTPVVKDGFLYGMFQFKE